MVMFVGMLVREFLGWDRPFLGAAVEWLIAQRRDSLPHLLLVVPTAQCGRRMREALAEASGAMLAPRFRTPGGMLQLDDPQVAPEWVERLAWSEVLERVRDWSEFAAAIPQQTGDEGREWAGGLALELVRLRRSLQEGGLMLGTAAGLLAESPEADRWEALAALETRVEAWLAVGGWRSRSAALAEGLPVPAGVREIVLVGVAEIAPVLERALASWNIEGTALVGAPPELAEHFSAFGIPDRKFWNERLMPWPEEPGRVEVLADPRQQAAEALVSVCQAGSASAELALGSADTEAGDELARMFSRQGWVAYHPGANLAPGGLWRWFKVWSSWLLEPRLAVLADLLTLPETGPLVEFGRARKAGCLARLRDEWMVASSSELERLIDLESRWVVSPDDSEEVRERKLAEKHAATEVLEAARALERWRNELLHGNVVAALKRLLESLARTSDDARDATEAMSEWLDGAKPVIETVSRSPGFWIEMMLAEVVQPPSPPPDGRVIDVQGWLELFHEPGKHLVLCGMNEGKVPSRMGGEPWLSEASRTLLGLPGENQRAARDAFLFESMVRARRNGGRVDLFCGKSGTGGEPLLPSRLLLAGSRSELPQRVKRLFREVEPSEAGMRWHADWQWATPSCAPRKQIGVTSLSDYLACPFRYYLKHVAKLRRTEADRGEWNHRDFGNIVHEVLERWGRDVEARQFSKTEAIEAWVFAELECVVAERFGKKPPLAVRIQAEALRQRLGWFARHQACERAAGWQIVDVERTFSMAIGEYDISGKIDRIERNHDGQMRILDYKTGEVKAVEPSHRKKLTATTVVPEHLTADGCTAVHLVETKDFLWQNLQLPLYAAALLESGEPLATPGYFRLPAKESSAGVLEWDRFSREVVDGARSCAEWIVGQIAAGTFWPPAGRVTFDDYRALAPVGEFSAAFQSPEVNPAAPLP